MELLAAIVGAFLEFCFVSSAKRNRSILGESPMEQQEARFWRWVGIVVLIVTIAAAIWAWKAQSGAIKFPIS